MKSLGWKWWWTLTQQFIRLLTQTTIKKNSEHAYNIYIQRKKDCTGVWWIGQKKKYEHNESWGKCGKRLRHSEKWSSFQ